MTTFSIVNEYAAAQYNYVKLALDVRSSQADVAAAKECADFMRRLPASMGITGDDLDNAYNEYLTTMIGIIANDRRMVARRQAK